MGMPYSEHPGPTSFRCVVLTYMSDKRVPARLNLNPPLMELHNNLFLQPRRRSLVLIAIQIANTL